MNILTVGIDIGIICLGLCWANIDDALLNLGKVMGCALINLMLISNSYHVSAGINESACKLSHSKMLCDRLEHFFLQYSHILDKAKFIFIEQQPPFGHVAVEQLIVSKYRQKVILIHPRSMHKFFSMNLIEDYDKRKIESQKLANNMKMSQECKREFDRLVLESVKENSIERIHDVSDAMLILKFGLYLKRKNLLATRLRLSKRPLDSTIENVDNDKKKKTSIFFEQFRYKGI
jgi:hypothetical protein